MILDDTQILDLIKNPSQKENIKFWREQHMTYDIFVNGGDVTKKLEQVKNFENQSQKDLRDKVARSTKDTVSYLFKPLDKVFSATGENVTIEGDSDVLKEQFMDYLDKLPEGISIKEWMQNYWQDAYITDPNGIIYIETDEEGNPYPTFKSINVIHDFQKKWNEFQYIIFNYGEVQLREDKEEKTKLYRVIDHEKDGLYYIQNNTLEVYETDDEISIIYHNLGFIPAINPSLENDKATGGKRSILFKIDEILEEYLRDSSIHTIYKFLHGYPIKWQYKQKCTTCKGTGNVPNAKWTEGSEESTHLTCPTCSGSGIKITSDISDGINLPIPKAGQEKLAPDLAGYIQPALETWAKQVEEMERMKNEMHFSLWGTVVEDEKSNTATGRFIDAQPVNDSLGKISATGETVEGKIIDFIGRITYNEQYQGCICKWGRRYLIETPDVLWQKYLDAKEKQAPVSALDYHYKQYLMAEYHNDLAMMERKLKEFNLEPYPHYSLDDLNGKATTKQIQKKILFSEWNAEADFSKDIKVLKEEFNQFIKDNIENEVNEPIQG